MIGVSITQKISDISTGEFVIFHDNEYCNSTYLKPYRRVKLAMKVGDQEKELFDGVIRGLAMNLTWIAIKLESFEHLLDRRILLTKYTYNGVQIKTILWNILNDINTRYNTGITLDCDVVATTKVEFEKWVTYFDVLEKIAKLWYEFRVIDKVLIFKQSIGIDRTQWDDMVQYRYDINSPDERTIDGVKMDIDWKDLTNGALSKVKENSQYANNVASIDEFGLLETAFSNTGDETTTSQQYIEEHKDLLFEFDVDVVTDDFFEADLGDTCKLDIVSWNDLLNIDGSQKILEKTYRGGDLPSIGIKLWKTTVKRKDLVEALNNLQRRVQFLEINQ